MYGVLPHAKAVGRMAGRRIAERLGNKPAVKGSNGLGLVGELASEIANEYAADLKRGAQLGPLSDFVDAVKGPTSKLADDLSAVRSSLLGPAKPRAVAPAAADVTPVADLPALVVRKFYQIRYSGQALEDPIATQMDEAVRSIAQALAQRNYANSTT